MEPKSNSPAIIMEFNLRDIMDKRDLSIDDVSKLTGLTRSGLYMMLDRLPRGIKFQTIAQLCAGLEVQPGDLFTVRKARIK